MGRRDDRDKPSWRDIDRKRDSSSHIDRKDPYQRGRKKPGDAGPSKSYKAALDTFFDGGELPDRFKKLEQARDDLGKAGGSKRQKAIKALREAIGRFEVADALKAYFAIDPNLPNDEDALAAVLQHQDEGVLVKAIAALSEMADGRIIKRKDLIRQRLRQIEDLAEESETASAASELRKKIG
mgnify:CR=1 FL=1